MSRKVKAKYAVLVILPYLILYFLIQSVITSGHNLSTSLDLAIPFIPEFIWIYHTIIPVFLLTTIILIEKKEVFFSAMAAIGLVSLVMLVFYIFFPAPYPRQAFIDASLSDTLVKFTRMIDGAGNTFPSGHVTFAWLLAFSAGLSAYAKRCKWIQPAYFMWAFLISISTLVLKQHFIVDVAFGLILALTAYHLAKRYVFEYMLAN